MRFKTITAFGVAIFFTTFVLAQETAQYTQNLALYQKALLLYNDAQYRGAQALFEQVKKRHNEDTIQGNCAYYIANCAIRLNLQNADALILDFVATYPTSAKRNSAFVDVGDYYFKKGQYAHARKWYAKVDENTLSGSNKETFYFAKGYTAFSTKDYKTAKTYLGRLEHSKDYGAQAKYYIGFMAYESDDYKAANTYFDQVSDQKRYQEKLAYYQADLNFKLGAFEKAITAAKKRLKNADPKEASELSKIIGESYFNLKKYAEAIPFLQAYKGKKGKWNHTDFYQLGYAYYKKGDYKKAISEFNKIIAGHSAIAQNAYYHLGESYTYVNDKQAALNAFKNASEMTFDRKIQQDAYLNYAKLSYDIGNPYQSVSQVLRSFLKKYPNTPEKTTIESLLIDSYVSSKNYQDALYSLEEQGRLRNREVYQKVAFYRGIELYNDGHYREAIACFEKAIKTPEVSSYEARATFWKAEANYHLANYTTALEGFQEFQQHSASEGTPEMKNIDYNIGYTYFKQKAYRKAIVYFNNYIKQKPQESTRLNDAYLRLGDLYFVTSDYGDAIQAYSQAIDRNLDNSDYPAFQKAISMGYKGLTSEKIKALERFINQYKSSKRRDDALYELANTYVATQQPSKAIALYKRLYRDYPSSPLLSKAMLREGLIHYKNNQNQAALKQFKTVAADYPNTPEAQQAIATARLIYIDMGAVKQYASWVKSLGYVSVTDTDLDNDSYQAAEKQYLDNRVDKATKQFNDYLSNFPKGLHTLQAHFYLAQLYRKDDLGANATTHYTYVADAPQNEFTEESLLRLGEYYLQKRDRKQATPYLLRLESLANSEQNTLFAQSNLMQSYYEQKQYGKAKDYAEKILKHPKVDKKLRSDAYLIIARTAFKSKDFSKAKATYKKLATIASGQNAAEALYYQAYFEHDEDHFEISNATIQKLAKNYSSYKYYNAQGLVLMAKNFYALKDTFQASYILENVLKNFTTYDDVVAEAQTVLTQIKKEAAKTNASIKTENE